MNIFFLFFISKIISRITLKIRESDNIEFYDLKIFFNKNCVKTFDFYKMIETRKIPHFLNIKDKNVKQKNDQSVLSCLIDKKYIDDISRFIIVIFFEDGKCCVTPSFYLKDILNELKDYDVFYQEYYTNPLELINNVIF